MYLSETQRFGSLIRIRQSCPLCFIIQIKIFVRNYQDSEAAPSLHITIKINSSDFTYRGLEEPECLSISRLLDQAGIDSIEVSGNGTSVAGIKAHVIAATFNPLSQTSVAILAGYTTGGAVTLTEDLELALAAI